MRRGPGLGVVLLAAAGLAAASCGDGGNGDGATAVVVLLDVPEAIRAEDGVRVEVTVAGRAAEDTTYTEVDDFVWINDEEHWPLVIPLEPLEGDPTREWRVEARAEVDDDVVLRAVGEGRYVNHDVRQLELCMARCELESCPVQGGDPADFPRFDGIPDTLDCPGCGDGNLDEGEECDDGNTLGGDGCTPDCREGIVFPDLLANGSPADYDCAGTRTAPDVGDPRDFTIEVVDFEDTSPVHDLCVSLYENNQIEPGGTCAGDYTSSEGQLAVENVQGGWLAHRIHADPTRDPPRLAMLQRNQEAPSAGGTLSVASLMEDTLEVLSGAFAYERDPDDAFFTGQIRDCDGTPVEGAVLRLVDSGGELVPEEELPLGTHHGFFDDTGSIPETELQHTSASGRFVILNVPVADALGETFKAVACGRRPGQDEPSVLGCEEILLESNAASLIDVGPARSDGPACPDVCSDL
ncbi:MAG: hypothetical protein ACOCV4_07040 [Myxococcota bacterium]